MLNNITIGSYYETDSLIHKMNSFIKIINTIIFVILTFLTYDFKINLLILFLATLFILFSKVPIKLYLKNIYKIKWFLLFIFIINFIFEKNIYISFILCFRVIIVLLYTMILLYTTKQFQIIEGLQILFKPLKIFKLPVNKMAYTIALALYFIPALLEQYEKVTKSQNNKGVYYKNLKLKDKISVLSSTITSMFILSIKKSDILSDSMETRFFDFNQDIKGEFKIYYFDIISLVIHLLLLVLTIKECVI